MVDDIEWGSVLVTTHHTCYTQSFQYCEEKEEAAVPLWIDYIISSCYFWLVVNYQRKENIYIKIHSSHSAKL